MKVADKILLEFFIQLTASILAFSFYDAYRDQVEKAKKEGVL